MLTHFRYSPRRYSQLLSWVNNGKEVKPRGMATRERLNVNLVIENIRDRCVASHARKMNIGFAWAEFFQYILGYDDVAPLQTFISSIDRYSVDGGKSIDGAYGPRIRGRSSQIDQLTSTMHRLANDNDTREAVISIFERGDTIRSLNVPCTLSLQFLIRSDRLHMISTMRSNDIIWGLTYDTFAFTMIQELVALRIGIKVGNYYHNAGSLHVYTARDGAMVESILSERTSMLPDMMMMTDPDNIQLRDIYTLATGFVTDNGLDGYLKQVNELPPFWRTYPLLTLIWAMRKTHPSMASTMADAIYCPATRILVKRAIPKVA